MKLCLESLVSQSYPAKAIVLVEEGRSKAIQRVCADLGVIYVSLPLKDGPFNKSFASNVAARQLPRTYTFFCQVDVDVIVSPHTLHMLADRLAKDGDRVISIRPRRLPRGSYLGKSYAELKAMSQDWGDRTAWGMFMAHRKGLFYLMRGFNEQFRGWGWEDTDYAMRAQNAGFGAEMADLGPVVLHQWHPAPKKDRAQGNRAMAGGPNPNGEEWGCLP